MSLPEPMPPRASTAGQEVIRLVEDLLGCGHLVRLRVTGRSMMPWLQDGAVVTLRRVSSSAVGPGDVVFFRAEAGHPVLHRVLRRLRTDDGTARFLIKGDACAAPDGHLSGSRIVGKVVAVTRRTPGDGPRDVNFDAGARAAWHRLLAAASSRSPRLFRALSRRLVRLAC